MKTQSYFCLVHPFFYFLILSGLGLTFLSYIQPALILQIPFLGPIGKFAHYLGTEHNRIAFYICFFATVAHFLEAAYAVILCWRNKINQTDTVKWWLQTFFLGFPSLKLIKAYSLKKQK